MEWFSSWIDYRMCSGCGRRRRHQQPCCSSPPAGDATVSMRPVDADQAEGRNSTRHHGFEVEHGSWMDRFMRAHGTDSTLLVWGRRPTAATRSGDHVLGASSRHLTRLHNTPTTAEQARRQAEAKSRVAGHTIGSWRPASVLCSFYDTPGPEEHAICTTCGASAVAKAGHRPAGSAVNLCCSYTQLMRRLARRTR